MQWAAAAIAVVAILWTALPLLRSDAWWIRTFDFPRVQIAFLTTVAIPVYIAMAGLERAVDWLFVTLLAACVLYQLTLIASYTPLRAKQVRDAENPSEDDCISIVVANVLTPNRNAETLLRLVKARDPDLLLFVETDDWWESKLDVLQADYAYVVRHPSDNLYGMHLYSRLELIEPQIRFLVEDDIPSIHTGLRLRSGQCIEVHCVHPTPPSPTENSRSTERDAELLVVAKAVAKTGGSAIVFGDLNDVAWSTTTRLFQKIGGLLDPRIGRGMFSTFHAKYPFLRWPLDHVFVSSDFTLLSLERLGYFGSDHFPIYAAFCHSREKTAVHEEPHADADDRELAAEKIEEADVKDEPPRITTEPRTHPDADSRTETPVNRARAGSATPRSMQASPRLRPLS